MNWGLNNLWANGTEGEYAVKHGSCPVNDFRERVDTTQAGSDVRHNLFERAFPCLFPYGNGGMEGRQGKAISLGEHVQWALRYHDRRFRTHETFPFFAFGILQRRQALHSAHIQMQRSTFNRDASVLSTISKDMLKQAIQEEDGNLPASHPAVNLLKKHVYAAAGRVMGSDHSRYQLRSQIWSTIIVMNPPSLWITINPCDLHDPVVQVFAGRNINMDAFSSLTGPSKEERARNVARDPYAAAKFFHYTIQIVLETLFSVKVTQQQVKSSIGIAGYVSAYFGTVEFQGRGSLHLHIIMWLKDAPSSDQMQTLLHEEGFRTRMVDFIRANIRSYVPGLECAEDIRRSKNEVEIAWSRPVDPRTTGDKYAHQLEAFERTIVRAKQVHTCEYRRCLVPDKNGQYRCKRNAPFEKSEEDIMLEGGKWKSKRVYEYLNGWMPSITVNLRCNNDAKILTNGSDTKSLMFYVTMYQTKKQGKNYNLSAVMAKGHGFHVEQQRDGQFLHGVRDQQRLLLFRVVNTINREQELSAPMVISYLMGWGDTYRSHHYSPIYWSSFVNALRAACPLLLLQSSGARRGHQPKVGASQAKTSQSHACDEKDTRHHSEDTGAQPEMDAPDNHVRDSEVYWSTVLPSRIILRPLPQADVTDPPVILDFNNQGRVFVKCQVTDYCLRGDALTSFNVLDFFTDTYEASIPLNTRTPASLSLRGRPAHDRVQYLQDHPKCTTKLRVIRPSGHRNLPNLIGQHFPRQDDPDVHDLYCASVLMLLKPWRDLSTDLKEPDQSWAEAFQLFHDSAPDTIKNIICSIQYFYECENSAKQDRSKSGSKEGVDSSTGGGEEEISEDAQLHGDLDEDEDVNLVQDIDDFPTREDVHGMLAIEAAKLAHIFDDEQLDSQVQGHAPPPMLSVATAQDLECLQIWKDQLDTEVRIQNNLISSTPSCEAETTDAQICNSGEPPSISLADGYNHHSTVDSAEPALSAINVESLFPDQRRAFDIIAWHLDRTLAGDNPPPLRMIIHGEGGTGKSKVIQTVTEYFHHRQAAHLLLKTAYTGVAASLISGKTCHTAAMISRREGAVSNQVRKKLELAWRDISYNIIDEFSMLGKTFLAKMSRNIGIAKTQTEQPILDRSFGGINVILAGDLHQFPPVATAAAESLYFPLDSVLDKTMCQLGRSIYEEFTTVVILRQQVRVTDPVWHDFLRHLRHGRVEDHHMEMLRKLVITDKSCPPTDFSQQPWKHAKLVTPRHGVRMRWNACAVTKHCRDQNQRLLISSAHDTVKGRTLKPHEERIVSIRDRTRKGKNAGDLQREVHIAVGMEIMVTRNIETDLDITNGARGTVVDIFLHPDEPAHDEEAMSTTLAYPPVFILVKLNRTRASQLKGLDESVIPVEPITKTFRIDVHENGTNLTRTISRRQLPVTAAYASTDYQAQGQTIGHVLIDIATPPTGGLNLFNLYVALSWSSGRETIRLLRDFDQKHFQAAHSPELVREDERLMLLDAQTSEWWHSLQVSRYLYS